MTDVPGLPFMPAALPGDAPPAVDRLPRGRIKTTPRDFVVEEIPAYAPSGAGEHLFVTFTKTDRTTIDAVRAIALALGCDPREAGYAGMKDRRAVTTQTLSVHAPRGVSAADLAARAVGLTLEGIDVHDAKPHGHKLKTGHLTGNRFTIVVRDVDPARVGDVTGALARAAAEGVPNAFGAQRFGRDGDNATRALAWLRGQEAAPRNSRVLRLLWSSLQSSIFNAVLDRRVRDGTWAAALEGDLLKVRASGGLFLCTDVSTDRERAVTGEVSPTGPIVGVRMKLPEGVPAELERRVTGEILGPGADLTKTKALGEGTRRALRVWVDDLRWERIAPLSSDSGESDSGHIPAGVRVHFVLPKGAYATTVLATALTIEETRGSADPRDEERPSEFSD